MTNEEILAEVEDLLRNSPEVKTITHDLDENYSWFGRVAAVLQIWSPTQAASLRFYMKEIKGVSALFPQIGLGNIKTLLHQARHDLRMKTTGPVSVAIEKGFVFDYFDEIRKVISVATNDVFFVDPYLDADFVSRYLPHVRSDIEIRLLCSKKMGTLLPAVKLFNQQNTTRIQVRSNTGLHDRYLIIDGKDCYQSGASFKDGAKASPTTLTQIVDAFDAVHQTYEDLWKTAKIEC